MGMYDQVRCEAPTPDGVEVSGNLYQTKDFDCDMSTYVITKDGRLMDGARDCKFHGVLNFYTHDKENVWREYNAKFTDGQLVEISIVTDN